MKFKYVGHAPIKDVDLVLAGIFNPNQAITPGTIFEIPDNNQNLIRLVKMMGVYEEYFEPIKRKVGRPKKEEKKEEEIDKEE